ncbi:hypothetical protein EYB26_000062 [Talaromyces marneffei]|uniref:uncharacterized protein n=1 Tax=Talaromyces marneffei TaxID=37727 RepID=UPI0012A9E48A|nr:uncharacterized protein EYB26_000062 [Talaromyces marneffei]QGA12418.1 hypothetical protein EYB26_000062 [Talaromyces marneffei]
MGEALDLNLYPSCYNCLSWSDDGELAVAAGDTVHLQLPQWKPKYVHPLFEKEKSMPWTSTKVRTNVFTHQEWKVMMPSGRDEFSIGAEQSQSTVSQLAWSHQGLGLHRRCVLAVLTSNLLLSLYEADGKRRTWSRVCVVNKALEKYFESKDRSKSIGTSRIRSFAWCPPLRNDASGENDRADVRWGEQLLTIATDRNDIVLVHVKRNNSSNALAWRYSIDVIDHAELGTLDRVYSLVPNGSLWADALSSKAKILNISCGPWSRIDSERSGIKYQALISLVLGGNLHLVNVQASLSSGDGSAISIEGQLTFNTTVLSFKSLESINFTGPLQWLPVDETRVLLISGYVGGRATLLFDQNAYVKSSMQTEVDGNNIFFHQRSFEDKGYNIMGTMYSQCNEPISGIVAPESSTVSHDTRTIYLTSLGRFSEATPLSTTGTLLEESLVKTQPPWVDQVERYRQRYSIQYELGDMTIVRTWGLATFDGWTAVAFTMHPGDVLEYTIRAEESTIILFTPPEPSAVFPKPADLSDQRSDLRSARLTYSACVCAINANYGAQQEISKNEPLLSIARQALTYLSTIFELPVDEEISYCDINKPSTDPVLYSTPKPASTLEGPTGWIYERCHTCFRRGNGNVGLSWRDQNTTICANGHTWNRCALTFLAIQEPYISMFCSVCDMSVLSRDEGIDYTLEGRKQAAQDSNRKEVYDSLYDRYDTCAYCGGKYQDE